MFFIILKPGKIMSSKMHHLECQAVKWLFMMLKKRTFTFQMLQLAKRMKTLGTS